MSDFEHRIDLDSAEGQGIMDLITSGQAINVAEAIEIMRNTKMLPISTSNSTTIQTAVTGEQYLMLEFAGDLLSCGEISAKEWHSIKMLLKSNSEENWKLVQNILKARGYGNI
jgi:hypothetical protein